MNIALVAHDNKKILMENLCIAYRYILSKHTIYATATTAKLVSNATGLEIRRYLAGHLGGEQQLASQISNNGIDLVIILKDPSMQKNYETNMTEVSYLCDVHNVPIATNLATAEALLLALDRGDLDWRNIIKD